MPIAILGVMAAGAIAQYMNSEEARKANKADMAHLQELYSKLSQPNFDPSSITPKDYKLVGKYVPEVAPHIQEINPTVIKQSQAMSEGQAAQRQALQKLQEIASSPNNPELQGQVTGALNQAQAAAKSRQASLMDQYARQGMLNSGVQLAGQLSAGEGAMSRAADVGNQAAMEAYRQRLAALQGSAQLGGQINQQDMQQQLANADIINRFNQQMAQSGQQYANYAANTQNQAQMQNLGMQQQLANMNTQAQNEAAFRNQATHNQLAQQAYQNQLAQLSGNTSLAQMQMGQNTQQAQDQNAMIQGLSNAGVAGMSAYQQQSANEQQQANAAKQQQFQNSLNQQYMDYLTKKPPNNTTGVWMGNPKGQGQTADQEDQTYVS